MHRSSQLTRPGRVLTRLLHMKPVVVRVREWVGDPDVRPAERIGAEEMRAEVEALLDLLLAHHVMVYFGRPVHDAEAYSFLRDDVLERRISPPTAGRYVVIAFGGAEGDRDA